MAKEAKGGAVMPRYIDAKEAIKEILDAYEYEYPTASGAFDHFVTTVIPNILNNAPTVDAEPVRHGRWIDEYNGKYSNPRYICSNCKGKALYDFERDALGNYSGVQVLTEHCPHCGAKMDEESEYVD